MLARPTISQIYKAYRQNTWISPQLSLASWFQVTPSRPLLPRCMQPILHALPAVDRLPSIGEHIKQLDREPLIRQHSVFDFRARWTLVQQPDFSGYFLRVKG